MNGRVYDPVLGRFLSADPNVDGVSDAQGFNRYSYVGNNPMNATDPSGYFKLKDILPALVAVVVTAVALVAITSGWGAVFSSNFFQTLGFVLKSGVTSGIAFSAGAAGGFASGFAGSLLNGGSIGDAFRAGAIGGLVGGATALAAQGIGGFFGADNGTFAQWGGRTLAHATVGGLASEAQGGQFRHGFYSSAASVGFMHSNVGRSMMGNANIAVRTATAATIGGTASVLGGGKFANGAVTSAFQHLFKAEATKPKYNGVMVLFLNSESDPTNKLTNPSANDLGDLISALRKALLANGVIEGAELQYRIGYNKDAAVSALKWAKDNNYDVILVSHGTTASDSLATYFDEHRVPMTKFINEMNKATGSGILSADTTWEKCSFTYGRQTIFKIWDDRLKSNITGKLMRNK